MNPLICHACKLICTHQHARLEANDDTYDLMCPHCPNEYLTEMTDMEVRREHCRPKFLENIVRAHLIDKVFMFERRAQVGLFDESWTREHSLSDPAIGLLIQENSKN